MKVEHGDVDLVDPDGHQSHASIESIESVESSQPVSNSERWMTSSDAAMSTPGAGDHSPGAFAEIEPLIKDEAAQQLRISQMSDGHLAMLRWAGLFGLSSGLLFLIATVYQEIKHKQAKCATDLGDWDSWSSCSTTCEGHQARTRSHSSCGQEILESQRRHCDPLVLCPDESCRVGPWKAWQGCDDVCGPGPTASRYRDITRSPGLLGTCPPLVESTTCARTVPCPSECQRHLGPWADWSGCSAMCDVGHRWRLREWKNEAGEFLHAECKAHAEDFEDCEPDGGSCACHRPPDAKPCPVEEPAERLSNMSTQTERSLQLLLGLQAPHERRHLHLPDAAMRDRLLGALEVTSSGQVALAEHLPNFRCRGWTLASVASNSSEPGHLHPPKSN
ncbi:unnamed protein product [Durusdinium trenchii]|uniref:Spondin-like TSP1 domain-containing protein n=1 Tax=Durusdinium trenchii TaxID=1381693 RepID=A0ABP0K3S5_9DINO